MGDALNSSGPSAPDSQALLRAIPAVGRVLECLPAGTRDRAAYAVRELVQQARDRVRDGAAPPTAAALAEAARQRMDSPKRFALRAAINATGVILHTGLGRAPLAQDAVQNLLRVAAGHSTLEIDEETGRRGSRLHGAAAILREIVGCEDALVVNNNAAAVLLSVRSLAAGRDVVISRGELVEIGGQFRIPDVITGAGARLVEVGTTNKTHFVDYEKAIRAETALLLHVHPSNFRVVGFTEGVPLSDLARLARKREILSMADLGSGALFDLSSCGVPGEPTVQQIHETGVDVCTWSGDKLLGGPQCGIITGRRDLLAQMKADPLMRALRVDKLILAALEATLRLYLEHPAVQSRIPTLRAITCPEEQVRAAADRLCERLRDKVDSAVEMDVIRTTAQVGGGSLPGDEIPSAALRLTTATLPADALARRLRTGDPAVFGRVEKNAVLLDLRTVAEHEESWLAAAVLAAVDRSD